MRLIQFDRLEKKFVFCTGKFPHIDFLQVENLYFMKRKNRETYR